MKWVLIAIGIFTEQPFVVVESFSTAEECFFTGLRIEREYRRTFRGVNEPLPSGARSISYSCMPSNGKRPPTCGMDDLPPC